MSSIPLCDNLTALILTWNEVPNIDRTLSRLTWVGRIVVVDSFSSDRTPEIASSYPNTEVYQREFDDHTSQWNYGLQQTGMDTEWVLSLDADYYLPEDVSKEITRKIEEAGADGYRLHFRYAINGKPIRSGIYPPVIALFRREKGIYEQDGHTQKLKLSGTVADLQHRALHDDRKPMKRWLTSQYNYASLEAEKLLGSEQASLSRQDKLRLKRKWTPFLVWIYCIFGRSGWRDGAAGAQYAFQRMIAEALLQYCLIEKKSESEK